MIKVVNPKDVLIVIKNEVLIDPPNLTIIYIKEQYEKEAKLSDLFDEDKLDRKSTRLNSSHQCGQ